MSGMGWMQQHAFARTLFEQPMPRNLAALKTMLMALDRKGLLSMDSARIIFGAAEDAVLTGKLNEIEAIKRAMRDIEAERV